MRKAAVVILVLGLSLFFSSFSLVKADSATGDTFTVTKAAAPSTISPSGTISYSITIRNDSSVNSAPQTVEDTLPTGFTFAGNGQLTTLTGSQVTFTPTQDGQVLTWEFDGDTLQSIPQDQQIVISYQVTASETVGTFTNTACLIEPEEVCATQDVVVTTNPNTGIVENTLLGITIGGILVYFATKLTRVRKTFEQKVLQK